MVGDLVQTVLSAAGLSSNTRFSVGPILCALYKAIYVVVASGHSGSVHPWTRNPLAGVMECQFFLLGVGISICTEEGCVCLE